MQSMYPYEMDVFPMLSIPIPHNKTRGRGFGDRRTEVAFTKFLVEWFHQLFLAFLPFVFLTSHPPPPIYFYTLL